MQSRKSATAVWSVQVPEYWGALMCNRIGSGPADKLLQYARLVSPQEALRLGLVDQVNMARSRALSLPAVTMFALNLALPFAARCAARALGYSVGLSPRRRAALNTGACMSSLRFGFHRSPLCCDRTPWLLRCLT